MNLIDCLGKRSYAILWAVGRLLSGLARNWRYVNGRLHRVARSALFEVGGGKVNGTAEASRRSAAVSAVKSCWARPCRASRAMGGAILWLVMVALIASSLRQAHASTISSFPCPPALKPNVRFWVKVFTVYGERDFIVHDGDNVSRVYQVLRLPGSGSPSRADIQSVSLYLKDKYQEILNHLAQDGSPYDYESRRVAALFADGSPGVYAFAAQNLHVQEGIRERFLTGLLRSRYFRPRMESIFRSEGLPPSLAVLAAVESGFYPGARSGAGAVGIWQFTRATGRHYLTISRYRDDRLNPERATRAAADLLSSNYRLLGNWPLAITAYDYGTNGTMRAEQAFGNDYDRLFREYNGPHFGFASRNYYAEFLAALQIYREPDKYFPGIQYLSVPPPPQPSAVLRRPHRRRYRLIRVHWVRTSHVVGVRRRHTVRRSSHHSHRVYHHRRRPRRRSSSSVSLAESRSAV